MPEIAAGVASAFHHPVSAILADGLADGSLDPGPDLEAATTVVFGAVTITGLHYLLAPGTLDADAAAAAVLRVVLRGLGPRAGATAGLLSAIVITVTPPAVMVRVAIAG
jgi:hypothetical protein